MGVEVLVGVGVGVPVGMRVGVGVGVSVGMTAIGRADSVLFPAGREAISTMNTVTIIAPNPPARRRGRRFRLGGFGTSLTWAGGGWTGRTLYLSRRRRGNSLRARPWGGQVENSGQSVGEFSGCLIAVFGRFGHAFFDTAWRSSGMSSRMERSRGRFDLDMLARDVVLFGEVVGTPWS